MNQNKPRSSLKKIGLIDSGLGGLTILNQLINAYPAEYLYLADTKHLPYGEKTGEQLVEIACNNVAFLVSKGVDTVVIACHTLSAVSLAILKEMYPHVSFYDVIQPVIAKAALNSQVGNVGILATVATIKAGLHKDLLLSCKPSLKIVEQACPDLVPLIEQFPRNELFINQKLMAYLDSMIRANVDTIILGCTHYPLIQKNIEKIVGDSINIVSAEQELILNSDQENTIDTSNIRIFITQHSVEFEFHCRSILSAASIWPIVL